MLDPNRVKRKHEETFAMNSMAAFKDTFCSDDQKYAVEYLTNISKSTGLTASEIARKAGVSASTLTRLFPVPKVPYSLSRRTLLRIQRSFPEIPLPSSWIEKSSNATTFTSISEALPTKVNALTPLYALKPLSISARHETHLESYQDKIGLELAVGNFEEPCSYIAIPATTASAVDLIAAYVPGDGMEPRYRAGEMLIISRTKPPGIRSDVVVGLKTAGHHSETSNQMAFCVAQIIDRTPDAVTLWQHKLHKRAIIDLCDVLFCFTIVALVEE